MPAIINSDDGVLSGSSGLKTSGANDGLLNLQTNGSTAMSVNASQQVTFNNGANLPNTFGFKNRIINGGMVIDQRNAGATVNPAVNGDYYLDRWRAISGAASKFSIGRNAGGVTPPAGFTNYLGLTSLSAYTVGASENFAVRQSIEGFNVADLNWGSANAQSVTLSFWVRSSLTGTFGATLRNSAQNRTYPLTYTISAANTWEFKTATIAGDTSGTWLTDNGIGIELQFSIGAGSSVSGGTVGAWNAGNFQSPSGCVSVVGTNGATFFITGVQLERGSTATSFDFRPYGTELQLCQRYYWKTYNQSVTPGTASAEAGAIAVGCTSSVAGGAIASWRFPVAMRAAPTQTFYSFDGTVGSWRRGDAPANATVAFYTLPGESGGTLYNTGTVGSAGSALWGHVVAAIEL